MMPENVGDRGDWQRLALTVEEAGRLLGIGRNTAYEAARRGELPTIRMGRRLLVPRVALENLLENTAAVRLKNQQRLEAS